jgi:hypothetical protein
MHVGITLDICIGIDFGIDVDIVLGKNSVLEVICHQKMC